MQDELKIQLETRLDAAAQSDRAVSPLPEAVAATVRRCARVRRAKSAAFALVPIALATGLVVLQLDKPADPAPDVVPPDAIAITTFLDNDSPSLFGRREYALIFADSPRPGVARTSSEHIFTVGDAFDTALIEALFNGS